MHYLVCWQCGKYKLEVRESKNHQKQSFRLRLNAAGPDEGSRATDIAPALSGPVVIRSKRNKRRRQRLPSIE